MAKHALLNNIEHKDLRVITEKSAHYGDNKMSSVVFPFEFKHVQAHYPIFFHVDSASQTINAIALFGFEQGENLFLNDSGWDANYIPLMVEREPFLIGHQTLTENGRETKNSVIHIDLDSPRVSKTQGQPLFLEHGGSSDYVSKMSAVLKTIEDGAATTELFMKTLKELNLLEPFNLDITLRNGSQNRLAGYHTINEDALRALRGDTLQDLNRSGVLSIIYMVIASHENMRILVAKKDKLTKTN